MLTFLEISPKTLLTKNKCTDNIYLFTQFFIHKDLEHRDEIKYCLKKNVENDAIDYIILLNEKIYSDAELGISSSKIKQVDISSRLKFSDVFDYVFQEKIKGYIMICNSDIFFSIDINRLKICDIHEKKKMFSLLRYEYRNHTDLNKTSLFGSKMQILESNNQQDNYKDMINNKRIYIDGARSDSWDTWILHTNYMISEKENKAFKFNLGVLGCDNKLIYLFKILGYEIYNDPIWIPTYHYHRTQKRDYNVNNRIMHPYGLYIPARTDINQTPQTLGVNIQNAIQVSNNFNHLHFTNDNVKFSKYIKNKLDNNENFIIPRIAGEENNFAFIVKMFMEKKLEFNNDTHKYLRYHILKNNAGIKMSNFNSAKKYSELYLKAFEHCDMYSVWENWGAVYRAIQQSHDYITTTFPKDKIWAFVFDIYHYLYNPWTWALRGKRLLIISPFEDSIKKKIENRKEIYDVDLFPDCEFVFIKPPQTQGDQESREFDIELDDFYLKLEKMKDEFDIALCSCGGYGNIVCDYIYDKMNKSAIYVGGVLQMYFGIYGSRWIRERPDILRIYLNKYWSRPEDNEKPKNFQKVEGSCYW